MKRSVFWILLSYAVLGLTVIPVRAQESPGGKTLVIEPGNDFRAALEKGVRLKKIGQPVTAKLLEPVYAGESLAPTPSNTCAIAVDSASPFRLRTIAFSPAPLGVS